jgi:hypothetical protein
MTLVSVKKLLREAKLGIATGSIFDVLHNKKEKSSVPDPDPPDPHVFGPPGSGSFYHNAKIVRKTLNPSIL